MLSYLRVPTLRAPLASLFAVLLLGLGLATLGSAELTPAQAATCGCKPAKGKLLDQADIVVTGVIASVDDSVKPALITVTPDRIYHGTVGTAAVSVAEDPDCPLKNVVLGQRWIVAAREAESTDEVPVAIGCTLSGPVSKARLAALERNLGVGSAPVKAEPPAPTLTKVETVGPQRFTRLAAPGAAMFVIGLLGFFAIRRLGRPKK